MFALTSSKRIVVAAALAAALGAFPYMVNAQDSDGDDPPPEAGRISYISGNVSIQPATADQWGQAYPNLPVGPGDRIYTDNDGRAEIQIGRTYVRIGPNSDVTLVDDGRDLLEIGSLKSLDHILVRVVSTSFIIEIVLDELESGDADGVEAEVIGAAGVAHGDRADAEILKRSDPLREDRRNGGIALQVDSADFSGTVINVEVGGDEFLFRLHFKRAGRAAHEFRESLLVGSS